ncbi:hypothetical protein FCOL_12345 [Flavobacterium columnare ATCC 49512]|uniref:Uncharacterized protein n=1 Tax=Flavobacterium columnare (strain ATCC 49512 / CIP 103533 / TG 44/87) TaxID=1041826 RepID=G8X9S0_FLACA|nr:hypothetical protein FCOL_12345 [Flavobacterium columnare ATCC 49512]
MLFILSFFSVLFGSAKVTPNVLALGEVGDLESLNFRLKTELCKYKTKFKLSLKPQSCQTPVTSSFFLI